MVLDDKPVYDNQNEYFFDISTQPAGMYFIWVITDKNIFVQKIIFIRKIADNIFTNLINI